MVEPYSNLSSVIGAQVARFPSSSPDVCDVLRSLSDSLRSAVPRTDYVSRPSWDYASVLEPAIVLGLGGCLAPIAAAMRPVQRELPWLYHYAPRPGEEDLARRIAFAELIGPDGPMMAPQTRVGFTLIAPNTVYPLHSHPAVELYWVIAGHALWATPRLEQIAPPGQFVLHRSSEPHSMRTFDEPLLALWLWTGDIDSPADYV